MKIYSVILLMLQTVFLTLSLIVGQVNAQEIADNTVLDAKDGQEQATDSTATDVIEALRNLRETSEKAQEKAKEFLKTDQAENLTIEAVRTEFTNVINGIRNELELLKPGSTILHAILDMIVLASNKIDDLDKRGDAFNEVIKRWKDLRSTLENIELKIKEYREELYEQLTHIVRAEQVIIVMKELEIPHAAVKELEKVVVDDLGNVRNTLNKWFKKTPDEFPRKYSDKPLQ
ncbi:hypothetical protein [Candidatus Parabeggiatoa sp. HSG14]|uniref:hypothetical protein n=1 Tax=Candidatus Parabeggiatoa sp. HSG14 TaxID=3055593 RepID=UPI0025A7BB35|nr:hypothetical protein [Thiotrichales bacterium HSG14]